MVYGINRFMKLQVAAGSVVDYDRLSYVARNFTRLQGLNSVALGLALGSSRTAEVYWEKTHWGLLAVLPILGVFPLILIYIPRYYRRRFGWVQQPPAASELSTRQIIVGTIAIIILIEICDALAHLISLPVDAVLSLPMSVIITYFAFCFGFKWPRRGLYILAVGFAIAFIALYPLWRPLNSSQFVRWRMLNAGSWGLGLALIGLLDHVTLVSLLPKSVVDE